MTRNPSETQATPSDPASEGPTDCVHCGQRIRRFGQTRRWCHDVTGNVQCKRGGVSGDVHPEGPGFSREARALTRSDQPHRAPAEDEAAVERHPYAGHPAAAVLADHRAPFVRTSSVWSTGCDCGWTGPSCDHPAHLTDMLHQAGLLADGTPPETPTRRADLDQSINRYVAVSELARAGIAPEGLRVEERRRAWAHLGYSPDQIDLMEQAIADGPPPETPTERVLTERGMQ